MFWTRWHFWHPGIKTAFLFYWQNHCLNINGGICLLLGGGFICKISLNTKSRIVSWSPARVLPLRVQSVYRCVYSAPVFYDQTTRFSDALYKTNLIELLIFFTENAIKPAVAIIYQSFLQNNDFFFLLTNYFQVANIRNCPINSNLHPSITTIKRRHANSIFYLFIVLLI